MLQTTIGRFKLIAYAEGISFLLLIAVTMPLKYGLDILWPNKYLGLLHGLLFVLYVAGIIYFKFTKGWSWITAFWGLIASILPFGTFVFDWKYMRNME